ncbi:methyl-accepting chemotaxis protein [Vibrio cincinnatiensis]|uniref:Methyl-accepting chemotaxis sensory transducer with Cache sensor n=1 Tax=Vibrio cincinnatiensis DSM 19608 TaxID=1123491 RepID=A0A1T4NN51_VIBCI|nr:methyl-accepting chemotaxis protein [Vibrio cincinnatiensis]MCG3720984.1 methyl-accepting chemotaxis protein [Vibrio cincinnatiensis]MCG3732799.1 methyl-accepting chemotaxis protein [Vibrio cincinnatiensis]MCG3739024.1 methyl-accepting chemotaxis protein [Vibrio cincinnatiensis]MCG3741920.1 methyl-accepting chemotaxis protein [Vibrio cincinnatiensis]SJZ80632.1 methyl-accepting chemotaxis sensory transducer with Cache sensor [Vibrio cincinnatiensis DSM 19608]
MNLTIRHRLYILSIAPLLLITLSMIYSTFSETQTLSHEQMVATRSAMMEMKKAELKSYLEIAESAIEPLRKQQASLEEVMTILREIRFGSDGYIFGYDSKGTRLLLGQSRAGLGENFINMTDTQGNYLIRDLINNAKKNQFSIYYFPKPGESQPLPKLSYSVYLPQWDLTIGTGFYTDDVDAEIAAMEQRAEEQLTSSLWTLASIASVIVIIVGIMVVLLNRSIMHPLDILDKSIRSFASGDADLTARMESFNIPEFARLSHNFNTFVASLQEIIQRVHQVGQQVVSETDAMTQRAAQVDDLASNQREETEQVATAMTEMTTTAHEISNNASQAAQSAKEAEDNALDAHTIVESAAQSVQALAVEVAEASHVISKLEDDVQNISRSLEVIQDIAEQTNLLALNAAIEAARAGDQGRGFAVVADEVRKLASRTQDSTEEIHTMIQQLKTASDNAVRAMDSSQNRSSSTVKEASDAAKALEKIQQSIGTIMDMNSLIATATEEQSLVGQEISQRIVVISDQSSQSADLANENRSGSQTLNGRANELYQLVGRFKV